MAITQTMTTSFKLDLLKGDIDFDTDTIKIALYDNTATLDATTAAYTATNEVSSTNYLAGGNTLAGTATTTSDGAAYVDFNDTTWSNVSFTTRGALIYKYIDASTSKSIAVLDFGSDKTVTSGTFTVTFPAFNSTSAIIRIE